jgi:hypothetical protein
MFSLHKSLVSKANNSECFPSPAVLLFLAGCVRKHFLAADPVFVSRFLLSAYLLFVSRFYMQFFVISRFVFCQQMSLQTSWK